MAHAVNAGARLDRLPISSFHYRIFWLVGAGMFFDGYDLYIAGGVLASAVQTKFSTVPQNLQFISLTFVGMTLGALITGFVGDKFGRRFTYQINLLIFGLASLVAAVAQDYSCRLENCHPDQSGQSGSQTDSSPGCASHSPGRFLRRYHTISEPTPAMTNIGRHPQAGMIR